jgi:hypothetical protein
MPRKAWEVPVNVKTIALSRSCSTTQCIEEAFESAECLSLVLPNGKRIIAFSEDEFETLHMAFQDPLFQESLRQSIEQLERGQGTILSENELAE